MAEPEETMVDEAKTGEGDVMVQNKVPIVDHDTDDDTRMEDEDVLEAPLAVHASRLHQAEEGIHHEEGGGEGGGADSEGAEENRTGEEEFSDDDERGLEVELQGFVDGLFPPVLSIACKSCGSPLSSRGMMVSLVRPCSVFCLA